MLWSLGWLWSLVPKDPLTALSLLYHWGTGPLTHCRRVGGPHSTVFSLCATLSPFFLPAVDIFCLPSRSTFNSRSPCSLSQKPDVYSQHQRFAFWLAVVFCQWIFGQDMKGVQGGKMRLGCLRPWPCWATVGLAAQLCARTQFLSGRTFQTAATLILFSYLKALE